MSTRGPVLALAAIALLARPAAAEPVRTEIGAYITSLADISESQRRFEVTFWAWLLSPDEIGDLDPARTLELVNAAAVDRQFAITTPTPAGRWSQVKFRATVRAPLDFRRFPFDRHVLEIHLEDAERDARRLEFVPDDQPGRAPLLVSSDLAPQDWEIGALTLQVVRHREPTNYGDPSSSDDVEFSRAVLGVEITRRHSLRILVTLLLGTFMGAMVAFFAALLPIQQSPPRYTLLSSALFVCIANRLLVDARLPAGSSLGLVDLIQLLTILGLIVLTGVSLLLTNLAEKRLPAARATQISQRLGFAWIGLLLLAVGVLVAAHAA